MSVIEVNNLIKTFRVSGAEPIEVLKGLSLQVQSGEFIAIMGPSGSGKSTLLNILASIEPISSGNVVIAGKDLSSSMEEKDLVNMRRGISSIIFQDFNLLPYMNALENVMFPMMLAGKGKTEKEVKERAKNLLKRVGLEHRWDHSPDDLSGGEQQRVGIARALANNPKVLLADEPTGNLDSLIGNNIMTLFRNLVEEGLTVILVTHDVNLSKKADRILILRDGKLFREEDVKEDV